MDRLLINIGITNIHLKNYTKALEYIDEAFKICAPNCSNNVAVEGEFGRGVANYGFGRLGKN
jgi:hypothetical protein